MKPRGVGAASKGFGACKTEGANGGKVKAKGGSGNGYAFGGVVKRVRAPKPTGVMSMGSSFGSKRGAY